MLYLMFENLNEAQGSQGRKQISLYSIDQFFIFQM